MKTCLMGGRRRSTCHRAKRKQLLGLAELLNVSRMQPNLQQATATPLLVTTSVDSLMMRLSLYLPPSCEHTGREATSIIEALVCFLIVFGKRQRYTARSAQVKRSQKKQYTLCRLAKGTQLSTQCALQSATFQGNHTHRPTGGSRS